MAFLLPRPKWANIVKDGNIQCEKCKYKTNKKQHFDKHVGYFHSISDGVNPYILYFCCDGSIDGRNELADNVSIPWMDMTGGQAAFKDGDLKKFGEELVEASRNSGYKIHEICRMYDPGLGLDFPDWIVDFGIQCGIFEEYELPDDVKVKQDN